MRVLCLILYYNLKFVRKKDDFHSLVKYAAYALELNERL